ncbi:unnamed protein product [Dibothriocephalus latus]|uniref:Uncharacterized protein n=1 Tax=Dibothriocephalus latus TaxID=60516 RepID=A0A3P7MD58_DIBLA|nr:unnamed protein product [Dibothriocephalus latus]
MICYKTDTTHRKPLPQGPILWAIAVAPTAVPRTRFLLILLLLHLLVLPLFRIRLFLLLLLFLLNLLLILLFIIISTIFVVVSVISILLFLNTQVFRLIVRENPTSDSLSHEMSADILKYVLDSSISMVVLSCSLIPR